MAFSSKDRQGLIIIGVSLMVALLLAAASVALRPDKGAWDPDTLCPVGRPLVQTVVLVDKTDPFSPSQQAYLRRSIERIRDGMKRFEKLSIFVLDANGVGAARFALCSPGSRKEANEFYENPAKIETRFKATFGEPLERLLGELLQGDTAPQSPIMEAIRDVAILSDLRHSEGQRRLIIFSDLLQYTNDISQYKPDQKMKNWQRNPTFEDFSRFSYFTEVVAPLNGVEVSVVYFKRAKYHGAQTVSHIEFWQKFFNVSGGSLVEVDPIP
jgi:hypothetical protein